MTLLPQSSSEAGLSSLSRAKLSVAVAIPCYNEAVSVTAVVEAFSKYLPQAEIYVYDNNSTDDTAALAEFLLSENARFITGQTIHVDGGLTLR